MKIEKMILKIFCAIALITLMSACPKTDGKVMVEINTEFGDMKVLLYDETPLHRDNFIKLLNEGYFDSLLFHRVISGFMVQGGDPESKNAPPGKPLGGGGPGYTIPAEFRPNLFHKKGALAAARQPDGVNPAKESSGSQFYIVQGNVLTEGELDLWESRLGLTFPDDHRQVYLTVGGSPQLDKGYTVFGEVVEGQDVIDLIASVPVDGNNRPVSDVRMVIRTTK